MAGSRSRGRLRRVIADRGARWARRRQGIDTLPTVLLARRIYILPTRAGAGLALLLLAMLAAGLNYNNSLALLLTFTLTGFALVGLYQCHRRLLGLEVSALEIEPAFAGGELTLTLRLAQSGPQPAADLEALLRQDGMTTAQGQGEGTAMAPRILLRCAVSQRGLWRPGALSIRTGAPHGLFRSWVWLHTDVSTVVYPRAAGDLPLPEAPGDDPGLRDPAGGTDEWSSLRPFREGDSPRQVAWKAYARGAPLLVKEYRGLSGQTHDFDFDSLRGLNDEARLSQLCQWIVAVARRGEAYGLRLPGTVIPADSGPQQLRACLSALALFGQPAQKPER